MLASYVQARALTGDKHSCADLLMKNADLASNGIPTILLIGNITQWHGRKLLGSRRMPWASAFIHRT